MEELEQHLMKDLKTLLAKYDALLAFLPISFIAGNLIINLNILLILVGAFIFYRVKILNVKY